MTKPDISLSYLILTGLFITAVIQITLDDTECPVCIECPILETKIEEIDEKNNLTQQQPQQQPQQQQPPQQQISPEEIQEQFMQQQRQIRDLEYYTPMDYTEFLNTL